MLVLSRAMTIVLLLTYQRSSCMAFRSMSSTLSSSSSSSSVNVYHHRYNRQNSVKREGGLMHSRLFSSSSSSTSSNRNENFNFLSQSVNIPAMKKLVSVFFQPSVLLPTIEVDRLDEVDLNDLFDQRHVVALIFDKDNTLTYTYCSALHPSVTQSVQRAKEKFNGNIAILSNSVGSSDDRNYEHAYRVEKTLGIPVIKHALKKPACLQEVLDHFKQSFGRDIKPSELCMVEPFLSHFLIIYICN